MPQAGAMDEVTIERLRLSLERAAAAAAIEEDCDRETMVAALDSAAGFVRQAIILLARAVPETDDER